MADSNTPPTVLNFRDDDDRATSCLTEIQRVLREHRFEIGNTDGFVFYSTLAPKNTRILFDPFYTSWVDDSGNPMNDLAIHDLALERLHTPK